MFSHYHLHSAEDYTIIPMIRVILLSQRRRKCYTVHNRYGRENIIMENRKKPTPDFYIQFAETLPLEKNPFALLSRIGCWERRSVRIYIGRSSLTAAQIGEYLKNECGIPAGQFEVIPEKDAVLSERLV